MKESPTLGREKKEQKSEKKENKPESSFNFKNRLNLNYSDFDAQKGNLSPRMLFRKRKPDDNNQKHLNLSEAKNVKIANKLKESFDHLMDFVFDTYFSTDTSDINNNAETSFKFTSLDLLINPLRQKFTWESWSPYEIALFHCCICKFGPNFDLFETILKTKNKEEIIDFYFYWKSSKYYKIWKNNKHKKLKKLN